MYGISKNDNKKIQMKLIIQKICFISKESCNEVFNNNNENIG